MQLFSAIFIILSATGIGFAGCVVWLAKSLFVFLFFLSLALLERLGASVASYGKVLSVVGTGPVAAVTRRSGSRLDTLI